MNLFNFTNITPLVSDNNPNETPRLNTKNEVNGTPSTKKTIAVREEDCHLEHGVPQGIDSSDTPVINNTNIKSNVSFTSDLFHRLYLFFMNVSVFILINYVFLYSNRFLQTLK